MKAPRTVGDVAFNVVNYTILTAFFLLCVYPFYYIFIYSISDARAAAIGLSVVFLPAKPTLHNYSEVFKMEGMAMAALISVLRTVVGMVTHVVCTGFLGYLVTKNLYYRKVIYRYFIVTMYFSAGLVPWYLTMRMYGLYNNFWVYIVPNLVGVYNMVLIKTFIEQLPPALEESAKIDGAGPLTCFFRIVFPLSMPILATVATFTAVGQWNSWFDNYVLVTPEELTTLQLRLWKLLQQAQAISERSNQNQVTSALRSAEEYLSPMAVRMTITMVVTLPVIFVYPFMQRYFVKGIMVGAIKG